MQAIHSKDQLLEFTLSAAGDHQLLGTESEKFGMQGGSADAVSYDGVNCGILRFFDGLRDDYGWQEVREFDGGPVIALKRKGAAGRTAMVTLEPGAQLELSGEAVETVHEVAAETAQHLEEIRKPSEACNVAWLATGYHPIATRDRLPWVPKQRYAVMREYFPTRGSRGLDMMQRTATVQVNLDFVDEQDLLRKTRLSLAISPIATAIFANSPFAEGKLHGGRSERAAVWLDADPDRTGLLPFLWRPDARLIDYVEWALDVPMYLFKRDGKVFANTGQTFRSFWQDGFEGHKPNLGDWESHVGTCFPEVRIKRTIELRSADSLPRELLAALPAFWAGLLYDETSLAAAEEVVKRAAITPESAANLRADVAKRALAAELDGAPIRSLAEQLVQAALDGLARRDRRNAEGQHEGIHLDPIAKLVNQGSSPADVLVQRFEQARGGESPLDDAAQIIALTRV